MVNCDNEFCIYEENGVCVLEKIELNNCGCCKYCRYASINEEILQ